MIRAAGMPVIAAVLLVASVVLLGAASHHGRSDGADWGPLSASRAAGHAPSACDVVVVIDGPARLSATPSGRATLSMLSEIGFFTDTSVAWSELATRLGMTAEDALQAIAGARTMLMLRDETVERSASWALLTEVEPATEKLIRERLKPVPKRLVDGQAVLMLENGRFLLATRRAMKGRAGERAAVLIAPSDSPVLFESCLPLLSGKSAPDSLDEDPAVHATLSDDPCDAFMLSRARRGDEPDAPRETVAIGAMQTGKGWNAWFVSDGAVLGAESEGTREGVPEPLFRAAAEGSILAFGAPVSDRRESGSAFARLLFRFFADVAPSFDGAGILAVRERPAQDGNEAGAIEVILGAALKQGEETLPACDAGMAVIIDRLARTGTPGTSALDFEGKFPEAVREATLSGRAFSALTPLIGPLPLIRWCYAPGGRGEAEHGTWWLAHISESSGGSDASTLRAVASALVPNPEEDVTPRAWATIGRVEPARVLERVPPVLATLTRPFGACRLVRVVEWKGSAGSEGLVRGNATVEFVPEAIGAGPADR